MHYARMHFTRSNVCTYADPHVRILPKTSLTYGIRWQWRSNSHKSVIFVIAAIAIVRHFLYIMLSRTHCINHISCAIQFII